MGVQLHFVRICFYQYKRVREALSEENALASPFKNGEKGAKSGEGSPRGRAV